MPIPYFLIRILLPLRHIHKLQCAYNFLALFSTDLPHENGDRFPLSDQYISLTDYLSNFDLVVQRDHFDRAKVFIESRHCGSSAP